MSMICGNWLSQCIYVTVKLKIADHLSETKGQTLKNISELTMTDMGVLSRLLAILCEFKLCQEIGDQFYLTEMGTLLQSNNPDSLYAYVVLNQELYTKLWNGLSDSLKTGEPAYKTILGADFFSSLNQKYPDQAEWYNKAMDQKYKEHNSAIARSYKDFPQFKTIVDVGGGIGGLLFTILKQHPHLNGTLYDLPHVISSASAKSNGQVAELKTSFMEGDFFQSIPKTETPTLYIMKAVLHDWDDEKALLILNNCRNVMKEGDALLIIEKALADNEKRAHKPLMDMHMYLIHGGNERTLANLINLISKAGFNVNKQIENINDETKLIEAKPEKY